MWCNARCRDSDAKPQVWKFSLLSFLITTAPPSLPSNHPSFYPPIATSRALQLSTITTPGFLLPVIAAGNIPNLALLSTPIQCQDVPGAGGTNLHQTLMRICKELYAVHAVCAWCVLSSRSTLYSILWSYSNLLFNKPIVTILLLGSCATGNDSDFL